MTLSKLGSQISEMKKGGVKKKVYEIEGWMRGRPEIPVLRMSHREIMAETGNDCKKEVRVWFTKGP